MFKMLVEHMSSSPESDMSERLKLKCVNLMKSNPSEAECYDLLNSISKEPCEKVGKYMCVGEISSFIRAACNVAEHYERPKE